MLNDSNIKDTIDTEVLTVVPADVMTQELAKVNITDKVIAELEEKYSDLKISGIDDKAGYKLVDEARKTCKTIRVMAEKVCKSGREEAVKTQKAWIAKQNEVTEKIEAIENKLQAEQKRIDDEKERVKKEAEEAERLRIEGRYNQLTELGCISNGSVFNIGNISPISVEGVKHMSDEMFTDLLQEVTVEAKRISDEAEAEAERIRIADEERAEQERKDREELEKLRAEKEERERKDKLQATRMELLLPYNGYGSDVDMLTLHTLTDEEFEIIYNDKKSDHDREAKEREEATKALVGKRVAQIHKLGLNFNFIDDCYEYHDCCIKMFDIEESNEDEWSNTLAAATSMVEGINKGLEAKRMEELAEANRKAAAEERERLEEEQRKEKERKEAEEAERVKQEALRPDKDKLLTLGNTIVQLPLPEVSTDEAKAILKEVQVLLNKTQLYIVKKSNEL